MKKVVVVGGGIFPLFLALFSMFFFQKARKAGGGVGGGVTGGDSDGGETCAAPLPCMPAVDAGSGDA